MSFESTVSRIILRTYGERLDRHLDSDVVVAGAGPAGMVCAWRLAQRGLKVAVLEKRLAPGGGVWGGGMGMSEVVLEETVSPLLEELRIRSTSPAAGLLVADAHELASGLVLALLRADAVIFNLMYLEDLVLKGGRVAGAVVNRTLLGDSLPIDPLTFESKAVVDATGHECVAASLLRKRGILAAENGVLSREGPMDALAAEAFVVERTGPCFPGLYLAGMSVCAIYGGPRMGPIFGGMLESGDRAAALIGLELKKKRPVSE